jgi:hypothetical protein
MSPDVDVLVVGGGPVGLAAAVLAASRGMSVAVVERRTDPVDKACGEGLMPSAVAALGRLGVDPPGVAFTGIRYDCETAGASLGAIAAPPYDVIDDDHRAALEAASPRNAVRLILPQDDAAPGDRYARAAAIFARWQREGVLVPDAAPRFYAYRMQFTGPHGEARHTRGVIGALGLPPAGDDSVLPHERTSPKAKSDRLSLLRAMRWYSARSVSRSRCCCWIICTSWVCSSMVGLATWTLVPCGSDSTVSMASLSTVSIASRS